MQRLTTFCWNSETDRFEQKTTEKKLGVNDILIATTHSGLCFTDVHAKGKGCGLGHEGVGIVRDSGEAVTHLRIGDRVGWGWLNSVGDPAGLREAEMRGATLKITYTYTAGRQVLGASSKYETLGILWWGPSTMVQITRRARPQFIGFFIGHMYRTLLLVALAPQLLHSHLILLLAPDLFYITSASSPFFYPCS